MPSATATLAKPRSKIRAALPRSKIAVDGDHAVKVVRAVTILKDANELYQYWRDFSHIPQFVEDPITVKVISETESEWSATFPFYSKPLTWRATVINDRERELIAWESRPDDDVPNAGTIRFEPAPDGESTEVTIAIEYTPPGGKVGGALAKLSKDEPGRRAKEALRRFKALMEAGEIPTTKGQPVGEPQKGKKS
jgi:uncharacterized membrane protein